MTLSISSNNLQNIITQTRSERNKLTCTSFFQVVSLPLLIVGSALYTPIKASRPFRNITLVEKTINREINILNTTIERIENSCKSFISKELHNKLETNTTYISLKKEFKNLSKKEWFDIKRSSILNKEIKELEKKQNQTAEDCEEILKKRTELENIKIDPALNARKNYLRSEIENLKIKIEKELTEVKLQNKIDRLKTALKERTEQLKIPQKKTY